MGSGQRILLIINNISIEPNDWTIYGLNVS